MTTKDINEIYKNILDTAWMSVNDKGIVSRVIDPESGEKDVVQIEDNTDGNKKKIAVLPLPKNLVNLDQEQYIVIHPLSENPSKPASPVVDYLRKRMVVRLNWVFTTVLSELLDFAATPEKHDLLSPEQLDILTILKEATPAATGKFLKLLTASKEKNGHHAISVSVYLTRSGVVNGKTYHRAAITKFTLYDELVKAGTDNMVFGIKLTNKERELYRKLFERVIPGIDEAHHYNVGSNANVAPFMDCMLNSFLKLFSATNEIIERYRVVFSQPDMLKVSLKWSDDLLDINNLSSLVRLIPPQRGNEGDARVEDKLRSESEANMGNFRSTATHDASGRQYPQPKPVAPEPVPVGQKVSFVPVSQNMPMAAPAPWEHQSMAPAPYVAPANKDGKVSFTSLSVGQNAVAFNQPVQQNRGPAFNNQGSGSLSGF